MFRNALSRLAALPRRLHRRLMHWAHAMQFDHTPFRGALLRVHTNAPNGSLDLLKAAVTLIADHDPVSLAHIPTYLPGGIAAEATSYADAWYNRTTQTCFIGARTLADADMYDIASCILHEMCHARLMARGIGYPEGLRVRVEEVCIRRELAFAHRLAAHGHPVKDQITRIAYQLEHITAQHVSHSSRMRAYRKQFLERLRLLKANDVPTWIRRLIILRARRKLAAQRAAEANHN